MRVMVPVSALTLFLLGCTSTPPATGTQPVGTTQPVASTQPVALPSATGSWRVVPLNTNNFPERAAILVNEQSGETWIYSPDQWRPLTRY